MRTQVSGDTAHLLFTWSEPTLQHFAQDGQVASLRFDRAVPDDLRRQLGEVAAWLQAGGARPQIDGLSLSLLPGVKATLGVVSRTMCILTLRRPEPAQVAKAEPAARPRPAPAPRASPPPIPMARPELAPAAAAPPAPPAAIASPATAPLASVTRPPAGPLPRPRRALSSAGTVPCRPPRSSARTCCGSSSAARRAGSSTWTARRLGRMPSWPASRRPS